MYNELLKDQSFTNFKSISVKYDTIRVNLGHQV